MRKARNRRQRRAALERERREIGVHPPKDAAPRRPTVPFDPAAARRARVLRRAGTVLAAPGLLAFLGAGWVLRGLTVSLAYRDGLVSGRVVDDLPVVSEIYYLVRISRERGTVLHPYGYWCAFVVAALLLAIIGFWLLRRSERPHLGPREDRP